MTVCKSWKFIMLLSLCGGWFPTVWAQDNIIRPPGSQRRAGSSTPATLAAGSRSSDVRFDLAATVSRQILRRPKLDPSGGRPQPLELNDGWQSVREQLTAKLTENRQLLARQAFYSAREEAEQAALLLIRRIDAVRNTDHFEQAWHAALQTLKEAEDFSLPLLDSGHDHLLQSITESHTTDVLQQADLEGISPVVAAQHYRRHVERLLTLAAQDHPWAAEVYHALGRSYQAEAEHSPADHGHELYLNALPFYRAALAIDPQAALSANQLAYVLLKLDRPVEARQRLEQSIASKPSSEAFANLAEVSRRLGDTHTLRWATTRAVRLEQQLPAPGTPEFVYLTPREFTALSPHAASPAGNVERSTPRQATAQNSLTR